MRNSFRTRLALASLFVVGGLAWLSADTLVLRDGRRVEGELISIRNGVIEFEEQGTFTNRVVRLRRDEVRRIEFDEDRDDRTGPPPDRGLGRERPSGLREREVLVSGDVPWVDAGIEVRAGQVLFFQARGTVWWGPGRKNGPEGEHGSPHNPNRPIPSRPAASLIGRIGDGNDAFFIGNEQGPIRARSSGRLYLGVNDDVLRDNHGNFRVLVSY
jgi:hypothetical protein